VAFVSVYVREAHPGERYPHHTNDVQKWTHARDWVAQDPIPWTVAVDTLEGVTHRAYGPLPNSIYLVDRGGHVAFRALWAGQEGLVRDKLDELLVAVVDVAAAGRNLVKEAVDRDFRRRRLGLNLSRDRCQDDKDQDNHCEGRAMRVSFVGKRALLSPGPGAHNKKAAGELTALGLAASRLSGQPDDVTATCCSVALPFQNVRNSFRSSRSTSSTSISRPSLTVTSRRPKRRALSRAKTSRRNAASPRLSPRGTTMRVGHASGSSPIARRSPLSPLAGPLDSLPSATTMTP